MSLIQCLPETFNILAEVAGERVRQDAKWGPQDHPSIASKLPNGNPIPVGALHLFYSIPSEWHAKEACERRFDSGIGTYADIAIEEVAEAVCAADDDARRAELVQCAAVFVAWIEAIDRRKVQS